MIEYKEVPQKGTMIKPIRVTCDICGMDARCGPSMVSKLIPHGTFAHSGQPDMPRTNEAKTVGVANLCEAHAREVKNFIDKLAAKRGRTVGVRELDEYGN